ncbi:MAG: Flp family type IVb pilin [Rhizobiaceae bacterium]
MKFLQDQSGSTAIEYGLIATLIVSVIIGGISAVGNSSVLTMENISDQF